MSDINLQIKKINLSLDELEKEYIEKNKLNKKYNNLTEFNKTDKLNNIAIKNLSKKQLMNIYADIVSKEQLQKELLTYEFMNYQTTEKYDNIDDIIKKFMDIIKKYQNIIGGYYIDDHEWIVAKEHKFLKINDNQTVIVNTTNIYEYNDKKLIWFMDGILKIILLHTTDNFYIKYKIIEDEYNGLCWLVFVIENI
jgi:hypothetical protein